MITLYDADRCPYAARVRIVLAEKGLEYEAVAIDLDDRPSWLYAKNALGKVPVLEEDGLVLSESQVIVEYLDERYPEPPLWPADPAERALARLRVHRFDAFGQAYYELRRGGDGAAFERALTQLEAALEVTPFLTGRAYGLADVAYVPWLLRARASLGVELDAFSALAAWLERLAERPAIAAEVEVVRAL